MLADTFHLIATAARKLLRNWQSTLLLAIVYAALLTTLYFFMAIREASILQVILTFGLAIAAVVLFFLLHAMVAGAIAARANDTGDSMTDFTAGALLRRSLTDIWKLVAISLPVIAAAVLIAYLLGKAQNRFVTQNTLDVLMARARSRNPGPPPIDWRLALISSLRYLAFGLVLPLAAIHLWLATVREGLWGAVRRIAHHLANAFAPQSVLIYIVGFLVFGVLPYFLLFKTISANKAWLEISFLVARLAAVFALTLCGWVITVWSLSLVSVPSSSRTSSIPSAAEPANEAA